MAKPEQVMLVEEALRTAYLELRTLEEQLDWFSSDSIEKLEDAMEVLGIDPNEA